MPQAIPYLEALQLKTVHLFNLHFMLPLPCLKPCPAQFDMSLAIPFLSSILLYHYAPSSSFPFGQCQTFLLFSLHLRWLVPTHVVQFDMSLAIPFLKASLTDAEYQLCTSVAADNFAGGNLLPSDACCSLSAFFIDISCSPGSHWTTLLVRACALVGVWA